MSVKPIVMNPS